VFIWSTTAGAPSCSSSLLPPIAEAPNCGRTRPAQRWLLTPGVFLRVGDTRRSYGCERALRHACRIAVDLFFSSRITRSGTRHLFQERNVPLSRKGNLLPIDAEPPPIVGHKAVPNSLPMACRTRGSRGAGDVLPLPSVLGSRNASSMSRDGLADWVQGGANRSRADVRINSPIVTRTTASGVPI